MHHDIAYTNKYLNSRHKAVLELLNMASKRLKSNDAGEWQVKNAMKGKV